MTKNTRDQPAAPPEVATPEEVLKTFTQIMRGDMTETVIRKGKSGEEAVLIPPKVSERCKAAEMLGKRFGLFTEKEQTAAPREEIAREISEALKMLTEAQERGSRRP